MEIETIRRRYDTDEAVRKLADDIHKRRMLPPPTCLECVRLAISKLSDGEGQLKGEPAR